MGLDMCVMSSAQEPKADVDFPGSEDDSEIRYWRKHPNLHGWMEALYRAKGGCANDFNCVLVALDLDDLERLETDVKARDLPETSGPFFGQSYSDDIDDDLDLIQGDLAFIQKAREELAAGRFLYYMSW